MSHSDTVKVIQNNLLFIFILAITFHFTFQFDSIFLNTKKGKTQKNPCLEFLWSVSFCIWTEYEDLQSKSPYPKRLWEKTDQKNYKYGPSLGSENPPQCFFFSFESFLDYVLQLVNLSITIVNIVTCYFILLIAFIIINKITPLYSYITTHFLLHYFHFSPIFIMSFCQHCFIRKYDSNGFSNVSKSLFSSPLIILNEASCTFLIK